MTMSNRSTTSILSARGNDRSNSLKSRSIPCRGTVSPDLHLLCQRLVTRIDDMKNRTVLMVVAAAFLAAILCGCSTSLVEKSVVITKGPDGKVVSTVETERVVQPRTLNRVQLEFLTGVSPGGEPKKPVRAQ